MARWAGSRPEPKTQVPAAGPARPVLLPIWEPAWSQPRKGLIRAGRGFFRAGGQAGDSLLLRVLWAGGEVRVAGEEVRAAAPIPPPLLCPTTGTG